jgi:hypothetical protein
MAFEGLYQNIDFQAGNKAAALKQQQFQEMLGMALENYQAGKDRQLKQKQLEAEAAAKMPDVGKLAENGLLKRNMGMPTTPQEDAAIVTMGQTQRPQVYTDPLTQQTVINPSPWSALGGGAPSQYATPSYNPSADLPRPAPSNVGGMTTGEAVDGKTIDYSPYMTDDQAAAREEAFKRNQTMVGDEVVSDVLEENAPVYTAPKELGARGKVMGAEAEKEINIAERKADIQFRKEQMTSEKGREKVTGTIKKTMSDLEELNDKLRAKNAIITNDTGLLQNLATKYSNTWVGRNTTGVTNSDIEALRREYETKRDSVIPSYIAYFDIPATVVDTEEMQKRILQSFGDPSLSYEVNQAALDNMRTQFQMPKENEQTKTQSGWSIKRK